MSQAVIGALAPYQPYSGQSEARDRQAALAEMNNIDKHRLLLVMIISWVTEGYLVLR